MRNRLLYAALACAGLLAYSAQVLGQAPAGLPSVGPGSSFNLMVESYFFGDTPVAVAALTGCSTGGSPAVVGDQKALLVTAGTSASTTCTITWPVTRSAAPNCSIIGANAASNLAGLTITTMSTSALTWTWTTSTASTAWSVICMGPR